MTFRHEEHVTGEGLRYLAAVGVTALTAAIRVFLAVTVEPRPPMLIFSMGAVGVAAWFGGLGPGLLATALCSIIGLFFVDPQFSVDVEHMSDLIDVGAFAVTGTFVAWLSESLHRARRETHRAKEEAQRASERERAAMKDAERRKDEFIAILAHELRNPLAPLCHATAVLRTRAPAGSQREQARCLDIIDRQTRQMTRLLDDLLDVSRIARGKLVLRRQRIAIATSLQHAIEGVEPLIAAKGLALSVHLPSEDVVVDADPVRLLQIFANVLTNAAKYTDRGGRIAARVSADARDVEVAVVDSGIGIEPAHMPHLFEMFFRSDAARVRCSGGLGLGLGLTRALVEMHGGTIEARSGGANQGSEFTIRLPRAEPARPESEVARSVSSGAHGVRVLVADDSVDAAESLAMLLELQGCQVRVAHDGEAALREAGEFRPRVAFIDIGMPRMDGYEVCRRIRAEPWGRAPMLVALTGWGQDEDRRRSAAVGFDRHLTKPADPQQVLALLVEAGERPSRE